MGNENTKKNERKTQSDLTDLLYCGNCGAVAELKDSSIVYGKSYGLIYLCENYPECDSFVGVHKGTKKAKGTLANQELRNLRKECHSKLDPLWRGRERTRQDVYKWLSELMDLDNAHIAEFNIEQCNKLLKAV